MGKKTLFLCFIFPFWLLSCQKQEKQLPVEEDKLVQILADVHLAEAALQSLYGTEKDSMAKVYYRQIYVIHEVEKAHFEESMRMIRRESKQTERVYAQVLEELTKREAAVAE